MQSKISYRSRVQTFAMESHKKVFKSVRDISAFFGVTFVLFDEDPRLTMKLIFALQICFQLFTYNFCSFEWVKTALYFVLMTVQVTLPMVIEFFINIEAFMKRSLEEKLLRKYWKLEKILQLNFGVGKTKELEVAGNIFKIKLLIILLVRISKIIWAGTEFSLSMMMTELVASASAYAFTFYVDWMTVLVKSYSKHISPSNVSSLAMQCDYLDFYKLANLLMKRFSVTLLMNVTYTFIILIINFYFCFIRIVYGPMKYESH